MSGLSMLILLTTWNFYHFKVKVNKTLDLVTQLSDNLLTISMCDISQRYTKGAGHGVSYPPAGWL